MVNPGQVKKERAKIRKWCEQLEQIEAEKPIVDENVTRNDSERKKSQKLGTVNANNSVNVAQNSQQSVAPPGKRSPLWNRVKSTLEVLQKIGQSTTSIENVSLQQQGVVQSSLDFVMGYAARCLMPYEIRNPGSPAPVLDSKTAKLYETETNQLTSTQTTKRFTEIMSLIPSFLSHLSRFVLRNQNLLPCLLHFLYSNPDPPTENHSTSVHSTLREFWIRDLLFTLPVDQGFRALLFHLYNPDCKPLQDCSVRGFRDILTFRGNVTRLLLSTVTESTWHGDCELFLNTTLNILASTSAAHNILAASSSAEHELGPCHIILDETMEILHTDKSADPVKRVALAIYLGVTRYQHKVLSNPVQSGSAPTNYRQDKQISTNHRKDSQLSTNHALDSYLQLFAPIAEFYQCPVPKKAKLSQVLDLLKLYSLLLELPDLSKPAKFLAYRSHWFCVTSIFECVSCHLDQPIVEVGDHQFLTEVKSKLGAFIVKVIQTYAKVEPENVEQKPKPKKLAQFVVSLIIGHRGKVSPLAAELVQSTGTACCPGQEECSDDESRLDSFQRLVLTKEKIRGHLQSTSRHISKLLFHHLDETTKNLLFAEFLRFDGQLLPDSKFSKQEIRYKMDEEQFDWSNYATVQKVVGSLIVSEIGSDEPVLDSFVSGLKETSLASLQLILDKLLTDIAHWTTQNEPSVDFPFTSTLVQTLDLVGVLIDTTYEMDKDPHRKDPPGPPPDQVLETALIGWENLNKLKPSLHKMLELKHPILDQTGISNRVEQLIALIETRGRSEGGAARREKSSDTGHHGSKGTVEEAIFSLSSAIPGTVGMGLIQLKKLILEHHPNIGTSFDVVKQRLLVTLESDDEYIYNHCINALVVLTVEHHDTTLVELLTLFAAHPKRKGGEVNLLTPQEVNFRLKIGEVLCKALGSLGPIAAVYLIPVLNVCFNVSREYTNPQLKMSAYQVVAALIPQLGTTILEQILVDIWQWLEIGLEDEDTQVRTAIWVLMEKLFVVISEDTESVGMNGTRFAKCASARSRVEPVAEDLHEKTAREAVRDAAKEFAMKILDDSCQKLNRIQILG